MVAGNCFKPSMSVSRICREPHFARGLMSLFRIVPCLLLSGSGGTLWSQVRLNEIVAATSDRLTLADERGRVRPGSGVFWTDPGFTTPGWKTGTAPLGFGGAGLGTNVASLMQNRTPNLYVRKVISLSAGEVANEGQLQLKVRFDDGFIAWINGREVARANAGPAGHFIYADQKAYNFSVSVTDPAYTPNSQPGTAPTAPTTGITYPLVGRVSDFLQPGDNILAIQLINRNLGSNARIDAELSIVPANAVLDLVRHPFEDANHAAEVHRNLGGTITNTTEGSIPVGSWLDRAAVAQSSGPWNDLTLRSALVAGGGYDGTGALRYSYSQSDAVSGKAAFSGPVLTLAPQIPAGGLTEADLENLKLTFRFRATANAEFNIRLDPDGHTPAASLTGLAALTPTAGPGAIQDPADSFEDSVGGQRTRTVNAAGAATNLISGSTRNTTAILTGSAMRDASFALLEDASAGGGTGTIPGALQFDVVKAPAVFDPFGFSWQPLIVRSWTAATITVAQLKSGSVHFDYQLPAGVGCNVFLEAAIGSPTPADRLGLGSIMGNGAWRIASLDTGTGTNQAGFISSLNSIPTNSVRVIFISNEPLPTGTRMSVDNIGYFPWRTYSAALSTGTNQAAFLAAVDARPSAQVVPVFEKTGIATAPDTAAVTIDDFALTFTKLNAGTPAVLQPFAAAGWSYFPGLAEPSGGIVEPADFTKPGGTSEYADWIELFNSGSSAVDLAGWSLTDSRDTPQKFRFPAGTSIAPGAALVVVADGRSTPPGAAWLHAPFSLDRSGEYLALHDPSGNVNDALEDYPDQTSFYSWGRDPASRQWGYLRTATPGAANTGTSLGGRARGPVFGIAGGFYPTTISVPVSTVTPGATIRYTTDGSDPTPTTGLPINSNLTLGFISDRIGHVIKARAFAPGLLPSEVVTHTYLINQHSILRTAPAVLLSGEAGRTFYKPEGILAIQCGTWNSSIWTPTSASNYNLPVGDGRLLDPESSARPYERPVFLEYYLPDNRPGIRENAGIRISSSPFSRPRLVLSDSPGKTLWSANETLKPSFNIFFRSDYGNDNISYPLIPEMEVRTFSEFRLRAGKNDISNPFIRDEFIRRLWSDMGQEGTVGTFTSVYLNGIFKGYYNLVERVREAFMQSHYRSKEEWDVNYIGVFENGDNIHWNTILQSRLNANLTIKANWDALRGVLDVTNFADYILLNTWAAMWDWPHNNWVMARERSPRGLWRCYVWDAEGGMGLYGNKGPTYQTLNQDLLTVGAAENNTPIPVTFRRLMTSPEFRLLFADRIHKHLFNDGALTDAKTAPRRSSTQAEVAPLMSLASITPETAWYTSWVNPTSGRRATLFPKTTAPAAHGQFRDPNRDNNLNDTLWPLTLPPIFSQHGGPVTPGFTLSLSHSAPAGSVIYYTNDGTDPRDWGHVVAATAQSWLNPIAFQISSTIVKARVLNSTSNEWSPLAEARFALAAVPASPANTVISEVMYHPPDPGTAEAAAGFTDPDDFEYIVVQNIGDSPIELSGLRFQSGVTYSFENTTRPVLDPGQRTILAKNSKALRLRYGTSIDALLGGEYFGSLKNSGSPLRLEIASTGVVIKAFSYDDETPWPVAADGGGSSLLLANPAANPDHTLPASWIASAALGGQPTGSALNLSYQQWGTWVFGAGQLTDPPTKPESDFDGDSLPNLMEFLTGGNPLLPEASPSLQWNIVSAPGEARVIRLAFPRLPGLTGYHLNVESSSDLLSWDAGFSLTGSAPLPNGATLQHWEKGVPMGMGHLFIRLKAIPSP